MGRSEHWMSMILTAGVEAIAISYRTVIKACAKARDVGRDAHWMSMMLEAGVEEDTVSYKTVINVPKDGMWPEPSTGCPWF